MDFETHPTRVLGLDIGEKRTGVALSDESLILATPFTTVDTTKREAWARAIADLVSTEGVAKIVVGMPFDHHGERGADAQKIEKYIAVLRARVDVPVVEWDERFTTVQAERTLLSADLSRKRRKEVIDKVAASLILQSYLDSLRYASG